MPDRDLREALDITEADLRDLAAQPNLRARVTAAIRAHTPSAVDLSRWIAEDVMDAVVPALAARDKRIAELADKVARLQASTGGLALAIRDEQIAEQAVEIADLRARLAATTRPDRAARRLADDAHPTARSSR